MLELVKTLGAVGTEWIHFAYEKDMNFGGLWAEYHGLNICVLSQLPCRHTSHLPPT